MHAKTMFNIVWVAKTMPECKMKYTPKLYNRLINTPVCSWGREKKKWRSYKGKSRNPQERKKALGILYLKSS